MERYYRGLEFIHEPEQNTVSVIGEKNGKAIMRPFHHDTPQDEMADSVHKELLTI